MNEKEFDLEFDFEKEYGYDLPKEEPAPEIEDEFDLESILAEDFGSDDLQLEGEYDSDFDYGPELEDEVAADAVPNVPGYEEPEADAEAEPEAGEIPYEDLIMDELSDEEEPLDEDYEAADQEVPDGPLLKDRIREVAGIIGAKAKDAGQAVSKKVSQLAAKAKTPKEPAPRQEGQRRKPVSPMRKFKNETLPLIILGITAVLILTFICGAISRGITNAKLNKEREEQLAASAEAAAQQETAEAQALLANAEKLAAGYDYEGALNLLNTFSGSTSKYPEIDQAKSDYTMAMSQLVTYTEMGSIANLSFHVLIVDPQRAFSDPSYSSSYKNNFVTVSEFQNILEQLYANDFILVDMDDVITQTADDGATAYEFATLRLPEGKTPIMITETYGYHQFMVDSDNNGEADKNGGGFATRLVVDSNGDVKAEYMDAEGNTSVGNYALVPILEDFIAQHPDFSYKGARAAIATTGYDGLFGYRTNASVITEVSQDYYNQQIAGAQEVANALREMGYTLASYSYANKDYASISADQIQADLNSWNSEVANVIGEVDTLVFAKGTDISSSGDYSGTKFTVLHNEGIRFFVSSGSKPTLEVAANYVRQVRLMVTGSQMANAASAYAGYFDAAAALDAARG